MLGHDIKRDLFQVFLNFIDFFLFALETFAIYKDLIYDKDFLTDPIILENKLSKEANAYKLISNDNDKISKLFFYDLSHIIAMLFT